MGIMVEGVWHPDGTFPTTQGHFVRAQSGFRSWVTRSGEPGPGGEGGFKAESGRYHLYISHACPWAHRTAIFRRLKRLDGAISFSVVDPFMGENGWAFTAPDGTITPGSTRDEINGARYLYEVYAKARDAYSGRVTVPVLWDKESAPSSTMNRPRLSGCSIALLTSGATGPSTFIRRTCARNRSHQRGGLRERQQRCVSMWLCDYTGRI